MALAEWKLEFNSGKTAKVRRFRAPRGASSTFVYRGYIGGRKVAEGITLKGVTNKLERIMHSGLKRGKKTKG